MLLQRDLDQGVDLPRETHEILVEGVVAVLLRPSRRPVELPAVMVRVPHPIVSTPPGQTYGLNTSPSRLWQPSNDSMSAAPLEESFFAMRSTCSREGWLIQTRFYRVQGERIT